MNNAHKKLDATYWNQRWENNETSWDIGEASPAIVHFMQKYPDKNAKILIPGCGNAHEAQFLISEGFTNITLIDIAPKLITDLLEKFKNTPHINLICDNYFNLKDTFDIIIEQTFFCALPPIKRNEYANKSYQLLNPKGQIIGLLFNKNFDKQGPPFGGDTAEYTKLFNAQFEIKKMELCYNSIAPRQGTEVFIHLIKK